MIVCSVGKYHKRTNKKLYLAILFLILAVLSLFSNAFYVGAESSTVDKSETKLSQVVEDIISGINTNELDAIVNELDTINLFDGSVKDKISKIINGEYFSNYSSIFTSILSIFVGDIREFLPFVFTIIAIGILSNLINEFSTNKEGANDVIHFVCMSVMVITIIFVFRDVLSLVSVTLNNILRQMKIIFPILITMMASIGSFSTISIYNPLVAVLTNVVGIVFDKLLFPIFIIVFIFCILGNLTDTVKLDKFQSFLTSGFKWLVGIVFTVFAGFLSIQGITAGRFDSVSIKATKFAIKSYIPIVGSYIADGMDFLVLGSVLVKNTIGLVGILIVFITILSPILSILIVKLGLQFSSAILEMCGSRKISNFTTACSKILIMPIVIILAVSFMYLITIAIIMCTANIF